MQISDGPSQIREALFSLNCCFESKCIISYQPDIEDFKTTNVKYYCPYKAIFEFGIPLVNLLYTCIVVFSFYRSCQFANCSKSKYPGTNIWKQKISERMVPGLRNKQAKQSYIVCERRSFIWHLTFAFENACPWPIWDTQLKLFSRLTTFTHQQKKIPRCSPKEKIKWHKKIIIIKCQVLVSGFRFLKEIGYNYLWSHAVENWKKRTIKYREQHSGTSI